MRRALSILVVLAAVATVAPPAGAAPRIVSAKFAERISAGVPTTLSVRLRDPFAAVNGLQVEFGDGGELLESACHPLGMVPDALLPGRRVEIRVPYTYALPGRRTVVIRAMTGDCTRGLEIARTELNVQVRAAAPAPLARVGQALPCAEPFVLAPERMAPRTLCLVNAIRTARGLAPLQRRRRLARAARRHARDMVSRGYFSHTSQSGRTLVDRLRAAGVRLRGVAAENIGAGTMQLGSPAAMVLAWMDSPPHRANLLDPVMRRAGVGAAAGMPDDPGAPGATVVLVLSGR